MQLSTLLHKFTALATFAAAALVAGPALAAPALKIGVVPGIFADSVEVAAKEAKKQGLDVQVVEFTDWATPNVALDAGDIDLNYYQNSNYLANAVRDKGFKLTSVQAGQWISCACGSGSASTSTFWCRLLAKAACPLAAGC